MLKWLLLVNLAATWFMTGVIWIVQLVHYPLFRLVGSSNFPLYQQQHSRRITWIVMPVMLLELSTAILLVLFPPSGAPAGLSAAALLLVLLIWLATFYSSVPQHAILSDGFDSAAHRLLVSGNWIRTIGWSLRSILMIYLLSCWMETI